MNVTTETLSSLLSGLTHIIDAYGMDEAGDRMGAIDLMMAGEAEVYKFRLLTK